LKGAFYYWELHPSRYIENVRRQDYPVVLNLVNIWVTGASSITA
jgi:hypothetical protein